MKLQLANYRSCLLLCVPFNSFLPSKCLALSFESRIDIKGEMLPFIIHGASSTHWRVETEEKSSAGGLTCLFPWIIEDCASIQHGLGLTLLPSTTPGKEQCKDTYGWRQIGGAALGSAPRACFRAGAAGAWVQSHGTPC